MAKKFLTGIRLLNLIEDPAAGGEGEVYFNTTTFAARIYADGEWKYLSESAEELLVQIKNTTGSTINKGTPVYITGSVGGSTVLTVGLADASSASAMPAVGLVVSDLLNDTEGFAQVGGFFRQFTTSPIDGQTPSPNSTVYVKAGGGLTLTKPTGTNLIQNIAKVARVHESAGSLIISSIMRTNDIPNIASGHFWLGNASAVPIASNFTTEVNRSASATYLTIASASATYATIGSGGGGGGGAPGTTQYSYSPQFSNNFYLGNGSSSAFYFESSTLNIIDINIVLGSTSSVGNGFSFTTPNIPSGGTFLTGQYLSGNYMKNLSLKSVSSSTVFVGFKRRLSNYRVFNSLFEEKVNNDVSNTFLSYNEILDDDEAIFPLKSGLPRQNVAGDKIQISLSYKKQ